LNHIEEKLSSQTGVICYYLTKTILYRVTDRTYNFSAGKVTLR